VRKILVLSLSLLCLLFVSFDLQAQQTPQETPQETPQVSLHIDSTDLNQSPNLLSLLDAVADASEAVAAVNAGRDAFDKIPKDIGQMNSATRVGTLRSLAALRTSVTDLIDEVQFDLQGLNRSAELGRTRLAELADIALAEAKIPASVLEEGQYFRRELEAELKTLTRYLERVLAVQAAEKDANEAGATRAC
jgi:hypothetical protein